MKKKLLITLGCSYTEGMGCYDFTNFPKDATVYSNGVTKKQCDYQFDQFHKKGWPNKLGKLLGYDKVLNMGLGGSSQSSNMKVFMQKYRNFNFSEYEVFILWWIPNSHRFSFYRDRKSFSIISNSYGDSFDVVDVLGKSYLNFIQRYPEDCVLETKFYLDLMEDYCEFKGYKLLWVSEEDDYLKKSNISSWLGVSIGDIKANLPEHKINPSCFHPNELGYDIISQNIYNTLKQLHPYLIPSIPTTNMEWEWDGKPIQNNSIAKLI
jgi:hypothetical protein